jgi:hypothetical protein
VEDPDDGDRLVVAVALEVEGGEAQRRAEGEEGGQRRQLRRARRPAPNALPRPRYDATPPGGGGGASGGCGAKEGKRPSWIRLRRTPRLAGQF